MGKGIHRMIMEDRPVVTQTKNTKIQAKDLNQIFLKLNSKQKPKVIKFITKQLKNQTLVYQNHKGLLQCKIHSNPVSVITKLPKKAQVSRESSEQLLLSTENTLSDYYQESIRIQNHIRRRELENNMNLNVYQSLSNKLSTIHENIINEHSRLSRSFYSL